MESNRIYSQILESMGDLILLVSNDGIIQQGIIPDNYHGMALPEDLEGKELNAVFAKDVYEPIFSLLKEPGGLEAIREFDVPFVSDGSRQWYSIRILPFKSGETSEQSFLIMIRNITPRKIEEENHRRIFENAVMGIYQSTTGKGIHLRANPALARIYGYTDVNEMLNEITDISHQLFVHPNRRKELLDRLETENEIVNFESRVYKKDGSIIWISENAGAVRDQSGNIRYIVGTVKDITERKQAEELLKQAKEDWERTFNSIQEMIIIFDTDLKIRRLNTAAKRFLKNRDPSPVGQKCQSVLGCAEQNCRDCPATLTSQDRQYHSAEVMSPDNSRTFLATATPQFDDQKNLRGVIYLAKDITEEKQLKKESEYRLQQVVQADKLKSLGEMVAGVAHEINNPNSFIVYNTSLLEKSWKVMAPLIQSFTDDEKIPETDRRYYVQLQAEMDEIIHALKNGSKRIKNVVANLKDFAVMEKKEAMYPVNINEAVEKAFSIIGATVRKTVPRINFNLDTSIPKITGYLQRLEQVIINLVVNATQALKADVPGRLNISTEYLPHLNGVLLLVGDNGKGISGSLMDKIFEPFFTTRREEGGTGLGLSVSYEIIREHNGKLGVVSTENKGTLFFVFLPVQIGRGIDVSEETLLAQKSKLFSPEDDVHIIIV